MGQCTHRSRGLDRGRRPGLRDHPRRNTGPVSERLPGHDDLSLGLGLVGICPTLSKRPDHPLTIADRSPIDRREGDATDTAGEPWAEVRRRDTGWTAGHPAVAAV